MEFNDFELILIGNALHEKMRKLEQKPNYMSSAQYKRLQKLDKYFSKKLRSKNNNENEIEKEY